MRRNARNSGEKELKRFIDGLKSMSDLDLGIIIAISTVIRVNMEGQGYLPTGLYGEERLPSPYDMGRYQIELNKLARDFNKMRQPTDAVGTLIVSYTLRCLNVPEMMPFGREMWAELRRGMPYVEQALKDGEQEKGETFPQQVWQQCRLVPLGLGWPDTG